MKVRGASGPGLSVWPRECRWFILHQREVDSLTFFFSFLSLKVDLRILLHLIFFKFVLFLLQEGDGEMDVTSLGRDRACSGPVDLLLC